MDLSKIIDDIDKVYGKGTIQNFQEGVGGVKFTSSGSISLDMAMGGGWANGRIHEIYGGESSGKTTAAIHLAVEVQKLNKVVTMLDFEHAFDPMYGANLGLNYDKDKWLFSTPGSGEDGLAIVEKLLTVDNMGLIIIDSVAAMIPRAEIDGDFGDSKMGLHARLMSQGMRKLVGKVGKDCIVLFINQTRDKIGVMFGNPETTTGGNALKFYASQRLEIKKFAQEKGNDGEFTNIMSRIKIVKNKVAPPFKQCEIPIRFGIGFDRVAEAITIGSELGIIDKKGSWYSYDGTKLGQGAEAVRNIIEDNHELFDEIVLRIKVDMGLVEM